MEQDDEEGGESMEENLEREQGDPGRQGSSRNVEEETTRS